MWRKKELEAFRNADSPKRIENAECSCPIADKLCELQRDIDEHDRFLGDLTVMLSKRVPQRVVKHDVWMAGWIWDAVRDLIEENKEMKAKLALAGIESKIIDGKELE